MDLSVAVIKNNIVINRIVIDDANNNADFINQFLEIQNADKMIELSKYKPVFIGDTYDEEKDNFIGEKLYNSWVLNNETLEWEAPIPKPVIEGKSFQWSEDEENWVEEIIV